MLPRPEAWAAVVRDRVRGVREEVEDGSDGRGRVGSGRGAVKGARRQLRASWAKGTTAVAGPTPCWAARSWRLRCAREERGAGPAQGRACGPKQRKGGNGRKFLFFLFINKIFQSHFQKVFKIF